MNVAENWRYIIDVRCHTRPDDMNKSVEHLTKDEPKYETMRTQKCATRRDEYVENPNATEPGENAKTICRFAFDVFEVKHRGAIVFE